MSDTKKDTQLYRYHIVVKGTEHEFRVKAYRHDTKQGFISLYDAEGEHIGRFGPVLGWHRVELVKTN